MKEWLEEIWCCLLSIVGHIAMDAVHIFLYTIAMIFYRPNERKGYYDKS